MVGQVLLLVPCLFAEATVQPIVINDGFFQVIVIVAVQPGNSINRLNSGTNIGKGRVQLQRWAL
jgi:hypothetical protein